MNQAARQHIFISYRRDDARGASGRLYDWLRIAFGSEHVFRDVASIGIGKWRDKIDVALSKSAVCIAVIGPRWANADNLPRLHDANDMVRHELMRALGDAAVTMVPALVENAPIPAVTSLPAELRPLIDTWNARPLREDGWEDDMRRLIGEIADATRLTAGPDIDSLILTQQRVAELEQAQHLQTEQNAAALRGTIDDLTRKLADATPAERPGLAAAFAELAQGRAEAAEDAFERECEAQAHAEQEARRNMAIAARNVANLAMLRDVSKAVSFFQKALSAEPQCAGTSLLLGNALIAFGDLGQAQKVLSASIVSARVGGNVRIDCAAQIGLGDVLKRAGKLHAALRAYASSLRLGRRLRNIHPTRAHWNSALALGYDRFGDALFDQGRFPLALIAFRKGLRHRRELVSEDPRNAQWRRDVSVSLTSIARVLQLQNDYDGALDELQKSLSIREELFSRTPDNLRLQRDVSVAVNRIGDLLLVAGDGKAALEAYRRGLAIAENLAARDRANKEWQRDLSVSYEKLGDAQSAQGNTSAALEEFVKSLEIREALVGHNRNNEEWQRDLSVSHMKIGRELLVDGDALSARDAFRESLKIVERLATSDHTNTQLLHDLLLTRVMFGDAQIRCGERPSALAEFRAALEIAEVQTKRSPGDLRWQQTLSACRQRIGDYSR